MLQQLSSLARLFRLTTFLLKCDSVVLAHNASLRLYNDKRVMVVAANTHWCTVCVAVNACCWHTMCTDAYICFACTMLVFWKRRDSVLTRCARCMLLTNALSM